MAAAGGRSPAAAKGAFACDGGCKGWVRLCSGCGVGKGEARKKTVMMLRACLGDDADNIYTTKFGVKTDFDRLTTITP